MRCPGQGMGYWKGGAVFDVACPKCGSLVEFFKDESARRCQRCGHQFPNPRAMPDCTQWCDHAEECLGPGARSRQQDRSPEGAFATHLLAAVEELFAREESPAPLPLLIFQHARQLVSNEPCDPRKVLAAALVIELECPWSGARMSAPAGERRPPISEQAAVEQLLGRLGMKEAEIQGVCEVIRRFRSGAAADDAEAKIVHDAVALARLTEAASHPEIDNLKPKLMAEMKTEAGRQRAHALFGRMDVKEPRP